MPKLPDRVFQERLSFAYTLLQLGLPEFEQQQRLREFCNKQGGGKYELGRNAHRTCIRLLSLARTFLKKEAGRSRDGWVEFLLAGFTGCMKDKRARPSDRIKALREIGKLMGAYATQQTMGDLDADREQNMRLFFSQAWQTVMVDEDAPPIEEVEIDDETEDKES